MTATTSPASRQTLVRTFTSNLYIGMVIAMGVFSAYLAARSWNCPDRLEFAVYLALSLAGALMKISLPGVEGTVSVTFFFVFLGLMDLSPSETLLIGCGCVLVQYFWRSKTPPRLVQLAFNVATVAIAIWVCSILFNLPVWKAIGLRFPLRLGVLACTYFLLNTFPVAMIIALTGNKKFAQVWRECAVWPFPYYVAGAVFTGALHVITLHYSWQTSVLTLPVIYLMYRTYRVYLTRLEAQTRQAEEQRQHAEDMASLHLRTIESLALAINAKDLTTQAHLQRVQVYAIELGKVMNLPENEIEALRAASLLHDIGKLAVPEHIISKPGRLTTEEFEKMKIHPVVGAEILETVQFPYPVVPIVRHHHEKWDGSGYPDGLKGEEIPIGARILAAVDCLDAMAGHRQYRQALSLAGAVAAMRCQAGRSFDPAIVKLIEDRYPELEQMAQAAAHGRVQPTTGTPVRRAGSAPGPDRRSRRSPIEQTEDAILAAQGQSGQRDFLASIAAARCEVQTLFDMAQSLGNSLSLEETLSLLATRLMSLIPYQGLALYVCRDGHLWPEFVTGEDKDLFTALQIPQGEGLSGWVAESRTPVINGNPSVESGYLNDPKKFSRLRSALAVPLEGHDRVIGVLTLYRAAKDSFDRDNLRILQAISVKLGASLENGLKYRLASGDASTDYLTGMPNARSLFLHLERECQRCTSRNENLTVLLCDLDGFKAVNDRFGHLEGNRLLKLFAAGVRESCRPEDYVARLGGDEFVIVISGMSEEDEQAAVARFQQIPKDIAKESKHLDFLAVSIGCARLGTDGTEPDQLLAESDRRMYRAKRFSKREGLARAAAVGESLDVVPQKVAAPVITVVH